MGGQNILSPPHIFEWGGPIPPLFRRPYIHTITVNKAGGRETEQI